MVPNLAGVLCPSINLRGPGALWFLRAEKLAGRGILHYSRILDHGPNIGCLQHYFIQIGHYFPRRFDRRILLPSCPFIEFRLLTLSESISTWHISHSPVRILPLSPSHLYYLLCY